MSTKFVIFVHGGQWVDNTYVGGRKEYIPIPGMGIKFQDFLSKLEFRLKKDQSMYAFDIEALVQCPTGENIRMKITDDFEWSSMFELLQVPTVYVSIYGKISESPTRKRSISPSRNVSILSESNDDYEDVDEMDPKFGFNSEKSKGGCSSHVIGGNVEGSGSHGVDCFRDIMTVPSFDVASQSNKVTNENLGWLIPGSSQQVSLSCDEFVIPPERVINKLVVGGIFEDKLKLTTAVGYYHLKNHVESFTLRSSRTRYHLVCKYVERCQFDIRASPMGKAWKITKWVPHTCELDLRYQPQPKVSSKVIAAEFIDNPCEDGFVLRPRDMQGKILREYGVNVKYRTALAAKHLALSKSYGDPDESFQLLPTYLYLPQHFNPGSIVGLHTSDDGVFEYVFFALAACVRAFRACRPVIVLDGTHLKGKYKGIMFIAAARDGNNQIVPLAFGIGDKENDSSWIWFLKQVRSAFGCPPNCLIISDQHLSIQNAIELVYPGTPHGLCTFHMQMNLRKTGSGKFVTNIFQAAACAYKVEDFDEHMENLKQSAPRAHARVTNVDHSKWANCKCPVRRYDYGTSNAAESINNVIRWGRTLPVCALLEHVRGLCQDWFYRRRREAASRTQELSTYSTKRLEKAIEMGRFMKVEPISDFKAKVISDKSSYIVDLVSWNCSCNVFQFDLIPCSHVAALISHARQAHASYVHPLYSTKTLLEIYAGEVMPIPDKDEWFAPPQVTACVVGTPPNPRQAGRPRAKRIPSGYNKNNFRVCSRCGGKGHYANKCEVILMSIPVEGTSSNEPSAKKPRKAKSCGICGVAGHTRLKCTDPNRFG